MFAGIVHEHVEALVLCQDGLNALAPGHRSGHIKFQEPATDRVLPRQTFCQGAIVSHAEPDDVPG